MSMEGKRRSWDERQFNVGEHAAPFRVAKQVLLAAVFRMVRALMAGPVPLEPLSIGRLRSLEKYPPCASVLRGK